MEKNSLKPQSTQQKNQKWFVNRIDDAIQSAGKKKLKLSTCTRLYLHALARYADINGYCYPTTYQIEESSGIMTTAQPRHSKILKDRKFLSIKRKYCKEKRMTKNYYTIHIDAIIALTLNKDGTATSEIIDASTHCLNIEPSHIMRDGSKSSHPQPLQSQSHLTIGRTNFEPSHISGGLTTHEKQLPTQPLDIVRQKAPDAMKRSSFDEFWLSYPRKEKKKQAFAIWKRNNLDDHAEKILMDLHERKTRHDRWADMTYIPMPTTYLHNEQWEDQIVDRVNTEHLPQRKASLNDHQAKLISMRNLAMGNEGTNYDISKMVK